KNFTVPVAMWPPCVIRVELSPTARASRAGPSEFWELAERPKKRERRKADRKPGCRRYIGEWRLGVKGALGFVAPTEPCPAPPSIAGAPEGKLIAYGGGNPKHSTGL